MATTGEWDGLDEATDDADEDGAEGGTEVGLQVKNGTGSRMSSFFSWELVRLLLECIQTVRQTSWVGRRARGQFFEKKTLLPQYVTSLELR